MLWSRSQHATGELFLSLKRNQEEPDAGTAAVVGLTPEAAAAALAAAGPGGTGGAEGAASAAAAAAATSGTLTSATAASSAAVQVTG